MGIAADFVLIVLAGLAGALLARLLRLPLLVGYIAAGVVIGPYTAGPTVSQVHDIELLAEIGVALLLFAIGLEVSFRDLKPVRRFAVVGGAIQILLTGALGALACSWLLGTAGQESVWFGAIVSLSSTMVVLKTLSESGMTSTLASRVMVGLLVVQDLAVVPMLIILPKLDQWNNALPSLIQAVGLAVVFLIATVVVSMRLLPPVLTRIARWGSRELFLVSLVAAGVGVGYSSYAMGLSFALGAFIAGLVLSESDLSHQALSDIVPLRDVFGLLFFVSVGMLFDPSHVLGHWRQIGALVLIIIAGKSIVTGVLTRMFGYVNLAPWIVGIGLSQVGEFGFVLARSGLSMEILSKSTYDTALTCTILTMSVSPLLSRIAPVLGRRWRLWTNQTGVGGTIELPRDDWRGHVVVAGCGRTGRAVARVMHRSGIPMIAVELNHSLIGELTALGMTAIWGDATREEVLKAVRVQHAKVLVLTVPDNVTTLLIVEQARRMNPELVIIARAVREDHIAELRAIGATVVVQPEFEGGVEMVRQALASCGRETPEQAGLIGALRRELYGEAAPTA